METEHLTKSRTANTLCQSAQANALTKDNNSLDLNGKKHAGAETRLTLSHNLHKTTATAQKTPTTSAAGETASH